MTKYFVFNPKTGQSMEFASIGEANAEKGRIRADMINDIDALLRIKEEIQFADGMTELRDVV